MHRLLASSLLALPTHRALMTAHLFLFHHVFSWCYSAFVGWVVGRHMWKQSQPWLTLGGEKLVPVEVVMKRHLGFSRTASTLYKRERLFGRRNSRRLEECKRIRILRTLPWR
ncbi:hypothetical protein M434DRAFT_113543 [Hypoxylon sp. CO27-5]|nr:hypothetical protein M434DRAFT_113543 [Hypoxylon sp. CO27-5]